MSLALLAEIAAGRLQVAGGLANVSIPLGLSSAKP